MPRTARSLLAGTALALLGAATAGAQATQAEMTAFPMPPAKGFALEKAFGYVGDYSYPLASNYATFPQDQGANEFVFHRYRGVKGMSINVWPRLATPVPAPVGNGDNCFHTHVSYGVWTMQKQWMPIFGGRWWPWGFAWKAVDTYQFAGGGSMSGVRAANGSCELRTVNSLTSIDSRFGWGSDFTSINIPANSNIEAVVVGATAPTHGWGTCVTTGFKACFEPLWANVWTLPIV